MPYSNASGRRDFFKKSTALAASSLLSFNSSLFAFDDFFVDNETDPLKIDDAFMKRMTFLEMVGNDFERNAKISTARRVRVLNELTRFAQSADTPQEREAFSSRIEKIINDPYSALDKETIRNLQVTLYSKGKREVEASLEKVDSFVTDFTSIAAPFAHTNPTATRILEASMAVSTVARKVGPELMNYMPEATPEMVEMTNTILQKAIADELVNNKEKFQAFSQDPKAQEILKKATGANIGKTFEERLNAQSEEIKTLIKEAKDADTPEKKKKIEDDIRKKMTERLDNHSKEVQKPKAVIAAEIEKEEKAKREKAFNDAKAQLYITSFVLGKFIGQEEAQKFNTVANVGLSIYAVLEISQGGPWQIAATCLSGFSALQGLTGGGKKQNDPQISAIMSMLKNIDQKLDNVLDNQRIILNEIANLGKILSEKIDFNHALVSSKMDELKISIEAARKEANEAARSAIRNPLEKSVSDILEETEKHEPILSIIQTKQSDIYKYALIDSKSYTFINMHEKFDNTLLDKIVTRSNHLDENTGIIPAVLTGLDMYAPEITARSPVEWSRGANEYARVSQAILHSNKPIIQNNPDIIPSMKKHSEEIWTAGMKIHTDFKNVLKSDNIQAAFEMCEAAIDSVVDNTIKVTYAEFKGSKRLMDEIYPGKTPWTINTAVTAETDVHELVDFPQQDDQAGFKYLVRELYTNSVKGSQFGYQWGWGTVRSTNGANPFEIAEKYGLIKNQHQQRVTQPLSAHNHRIHIGSSSANARKPFNKEQDYGSEIYHVYKIEFQKDIGNTTLANASFGGGNQGIIFSEIDATCQRLHPKTRELSPVKETAKVRIAYMTDGLRNKMFAGTRINETKDLVDLIGTETNNYYGYLKDQLNAEFTQAFAEDIKSEKGQKIHAFKTIMQSMSYLAGLNYWHGGGEEKVANAISKDTKTLYAENKELEILYKEITKNTPDDEIILENGKPISTADYVSEKMKSLLKKNLSEFRAMYFPEKENSGFPEVNTALINIGMLHQMGPEYFKG